MDFKYLYEQGGYGEGELTEYQRGVVAGFKAVRDRFIPGCLDNLFEDEDELSLRERIEKEIVAEAFDMLDYWIERETYEYIVVETDHNIVEQRENEKSDG